MTDASDHSLKLPRLSGHFLWMGPLLAVAALLSYPTFFVQWPVFRDTAWLNLLLLLLAVALSIAGLRRNWPVRGWRRLAGIGGTVLSVTLATFFMWYLYENTYWLPPADVTALNGTRIPAVSLASETGELVDLGAAAKGPLLLVFYRGHW